MTTPTRLGDRQPALEESSSSVTANLLSVSAFPRHYSNIRWRVFLANRGINSGWGYRLPAVYRSER